MTRLADVDPQEIRRLAEASAWRARLDEHGVESCDGFEAWIAADPANEAAWDRMMAGWRHVDDQANSLDMLALRRDALDRARQAGRRRRWHGWWPRVAALAASVLLLLAVGLGGLYGFQAWQASQPTVYATGLAERRVITLPDGSEVRLDAGTELRVRYSDDARRLDLLRGQARFEVARDLLRPFAVHAGDHVVVATGTAFNVDVLGPKLMVTLLEGKVMVLNKKAPAAQPAETPITMKAGEELVLAPAAPPKVVPANIERASAWESGMLLFEDEPLAAVAARVSRYSPAPIVVEPDAAGHHISGVFKAGDIATFIDVVTRYLPVKAVEGPKGETRILTKG